MEKLALLFVYLLVGFGVQMLSRVFKSKMKSAAVCIIWIGFLVINMIGFFAEGNPVFGVIMLLVGTFAFWWKAITLFFLER